MKKAIKKKLEFNISEMRACECEAFTEASREELRVLVALRECSGSVSSDELSKLAGVSMVRLGAALEFWKFAGVISERRVAAKGNYENKVIEEFHTEETREVTTAKDLISVIKNHNLADLFEELARMMKKAMLSPLEMQNIADLVAKYEITESYLLALAAHMMETEKRLTGRRLCDKAKSLLEKGIADDDALGTYITSAEGEGNKKYIEYRRTLGIFNRPLADTEMKLMDKWLDEFCYGTEILKKAYDASVMATGERSMQYIDRLLSDWHSAGCKTAEECEIRHEAERVRISAEYNERRTSAPKRREKKEQPTTRFGNFDPEEVMKRALERTYASTEAETATPEESKDV